MTTVVLYPKGLSLPKVVEALILGGEFQPTTYEFIEETNDSIHMILIWDKAEYPTDLRPSIPVDFSGWDTENKVLLLNRVKQYFHVDSLDS